MIRTFFSIVPEKSGYVCMLKREGYSLLNTNTFGDSGRADSLTYIGSRCFTDKVSVPCYLVEGRRFLELNLHTVLQSFGVEISPPVITGGWMGGQN
jgi:hypothetical protein